MQSLRSERSGVTLDRRSRAAARPRTRIIAAAVALAMLGMSAPERAEATGSGTLWGTAQHDRLCELSLEPPAWLLELEAEIESGTLHIWREFLLRLWVRIIRTIFDHRVEQALAWKAAKCVRLNELQVLGSHNSYKIRPAPSLQTLLAAFLGPLAEGFEYSNDPLDMQFGEQGIRQIEIDVFLDRDGGLYADPAAPRVIESQGLPADPPHDVEGVLEAAGPKVLHIQDIDFRTHCLTFEACLIQVRDWSDANPGHLPLALLIEAKDGAIPDPGFGFVIPTPFDVEGLLELEEIARAVFSPDRMLTPDDVRGDAATLNEVATGGGWPRLAALRGQVFFLLDNPGGLRADYVAERPGLEGAVFFTDSPPGAPESAFVKVNDPLGDPTLISDLVAAGYLVRTRADADTAEARSGDTTRRDAALASGAHFVSTDYVVPDPAFGTGYTVDIPGDGVARCNPVNAPDFCRDEALERLAPKQARNLRPANATEARV